jgi:hypothetical protein
LIGEKGTEKNILFLPLVIERTQLINVPLQHREKKPRFFKSNFFFFKGNKNNQTKLTGHYRIGLIDHFFFYLKKERRILVFDHSKLKEKKNRNNSSTIRILTNS